MKSFLSLSLFLCVCTNLCHAAKLRVEPQDAQPGDVLTVTVWPESGEKLIGVGMAAFDTAELKFYARSDGSARALLGFPFDRKGGSYTMRARVKVGRGDASQTEQIVSTLFKARERIYPTQHISMKASTATTMTKKDALRREKLLVQKTMRDSHPAALWSGSWLTPTAGRSTSSYGRRRYVNGKWWGQHNGADIKAPTGAPIAAANRGRVVLSQLLPTLRGNCTVIDHGCNVFTVYMHQSQRLVHVGDTVRRGQVIGKVGATGFATGPHLHWEVRIGWEPVDPARVVQKGIRF